MKPDSAIEIASASPKTDARWALEKESLQILSAAVERLAAGFRTLPALASAGLETQAMERVLMQAAVRLHDNYPYFHPLYAGQMLKPPHPVARLAYALAMWINPNNHALDGGRATSAMEKEAVEEIASMFGWKAVPGDMCSGGTSASCEALGVAGEVWGGEKVVAGVQGHDTYGRVCGVLQLPFETVPCDSRGRMDASALAKRT